MKAIIGTVTVVGCLLGGYLPHGSIGILIQPLELLIICGGAFGAYVIATPGWAIKKGIGDAVGLIKPSPFDKEAYQQLLGLMFKLFNKARREGLMSIEADVEDPHASALFGEFPKVIADHHVSDFITDYLRMMISGATNPYQIEDLMNLEIDAHHHHAVLPAHAIAEVGQALPAFGIVAAVMGIIVTMSYLDAGPMEIAHHMSVALVGTFLGILAAYGFVVPISTAIVMKAEEEGAYYATIKTCILANLNGYAPPVAVEFGRKSVPSGSRPAFKDLDEYLQSIK
ncbi:MAG: flagellar motor stator protein MotA [Proteobacteria bacterium]|nr:flagellar motor stator protein MotA [Pseudomonadota bacterium]